MHAVVALASQEEESVTYVFSPPDSVVTKSIDIINAALPGSPVTEALARAALGKLAPNLLAEYFCDGDCVDFPPMNLVLQDSVLHGVTSVGIAVASVTVDAKIVARKQTEEPCGYTSAFIEWLAKMHQHVAETGGHDYPQFKGKQWVDVARHRKARRFTVRWLVTIDVVGQTYRMAPIDEVQLVRSECCPRYP